MQYTKNQGEKFYKQLELKKKKDAYFQRSKKMPIDDGKKPHDSGVTRLRR